MNVRIQLESITYTECSLTHLISDITNTNQKGIFENYLFHFDGISILLAVMSNM